MAWMRRLLSCTALLLGLVGSLICLGLLAVCWVSAARLDATTRVVFERLDHTIMNGRERIPATRDKLATARGCVTDVEATLRSWSEREVRQRLTSQLDIAKKTQTLDSIVTQADHWLEILATSLELLQETARTLRPAGGPEEQRVGELLAAITRVRGSCTEIGGFLATVRERTQDAEEPLAREAIEELLALSLSAAAALEVVDTGIAEVDESLALAQTELRQWERRIRRWIIIGAAALSLLVAWMLAGQAALSKLAWNWLWPRASGSP